MSFIHSFKSNCYFPETILNTGITFEFFFTRLFIPVFIWNKRMYTLRQTIGWILSASLETSHSLNASNMEGQDISDENFH